MRIKLVANRSSPTRHLATRQRGGATFHHAERQRVGVTLA